MASLASPLAQISGIWSHHKHHHHHNHHHHHHKNHGPVDVFLDGEKVSIVTHPTPHHRSQVIAPLHINLHDILTFKHQSPCVWSLVTFSRVKAKPVSGNIFLPQCLTFQTSNDEQCKAFVDFAQRQLCENVGARRPKSLHIFVNPVGGKRQAVARWASVQHLFEEAAVQFKVVVTERANHARDTVASYSTEELENLSGVVVVGGDGMLQEVISGFLGRADHHRHGHLRFGVIPAGSTDTVAYTLVGTNDPHTLALQILLGDAQKMDLMKFEHSNQETRYALSFVGLGFYGQVIKGSEPLRWLGPSRYDIAGFEAFVKHKAWPATVSYKHASFAQDSKPQQHTGQFVCVNMGNIACKCAKAPKGAFPEVQPDSGSFQLTMLEKTSRARFLHHLVRVSGKGDPFDFDFIQMAHANEVEIKTGPGVLPPPKQFSWTPNASASPLQPAYWSVDGELMPPGDARVSVLPSIVCLFARHSLLTTQSPWS